MFYVARNIEYVEDGGRDYWQSPGETVARRAGDCEDMAILALFMLERDTDAVAFMAAGHGHAWIVADGKHWEPETAYEYQEPQPYERLYSYEQVKR